MSTATLDYPLGLPLLPAVTVRRRRLIPVDAAVLVGEGDQVRPDQPIAELPGPTGAQPLFAGLAGHVVEVAPGQSLTIEGVVTLLNGLVGFGPPAAGPLVMLPRGEAVAVVPITPRAIILHPQQASLTLLQRAAAGGAAGIIAGSVGTRELEAFVRADMSVLLEAGATGSPHLPLTVVLTEGLGARPMHPATYQLLAQRLNETLWIAGATDPRRGVRPEVLLPQPFGTPTSMPPVDSRIVPGTRIAVSAGQQRGLRGGVRHVFTRRQLDANGLLVSCAVVRFDDGTAAVMPIHELDRIG
jgi:hypothetical protein